MDTSPAIERLQIPQFQWWNEALHGVGRNGYATVFPITMAMAASWDDALLHRVFTAVSDEGQIMALRHRELNVRGIQFHPESVLTPEGKIMIQNFLFQ